MRREDQNPGWRKGEFTSILSFTLSPKQWKQDMKIKCRRCSGPRDIRGEVCSRCELDMKLKGEKWR